MAAFRVISVTTSRELTTRDPSLAAVLQRRGFIVIQLTTP